MAIPKKEPEKMIVNIDKLKKRRNISDIRTGCYEGFNRIFNNQNLYSKYRVIVESSGADYLSILSDWENVGSDLNKAIKDYEYSYLGEQSD